MVSEFEDKFFGVPKLIILLFRDLMVSEFEDKFFEVPKLIILVGPVDGPSRGFLTGTLYRGYDFIKKSVFTLILNPGVVLIQLNSL